MQSPAPRRINRIMRRLLGIKLSASFVQSMQLLGYSLPQDDPGPASVIGFDNTGTGRIICQAAAAPEDYAAAITANVQIQ